MKMMMMVVVVMVVVIVLSLSVLAAISAAMPGISPPGVFHGWAFSSAGVTERDSPALALVLAPALARTVYLLATSPIAILPLLQLRILVLCNPQPMEHLHIFPVPCRHIILSSSSPVAADDVNLRLDSNEQTDERTAGEPNSLLKKAGE